MESTNNWVRPSNPRRPSVKKCGLKTKTNIPKGAPPKKPVGGAGRSNTEGNELSKVFAALKKEKESTGTSDNSSSTMPLQKPGIGKLINQFQDEKNKINPGKVSVGCLPKNNSLGSVPVSQNSKKTESTYLFPKTGSPSIGNTSSKPILSVKPAFPKPSKNCIQSGSTQKTDILDRTKNNNTTSSQKPVVKGKLSAAIMKFEDNQNGMSYNKAPPPPASKKLLQSQCDTTKTGHVMPPSPRKPPRTELETEISATNACTGAGKNNVNQNTDGLLHTESDVSNYNSNEQRGTVGEQGNLSGTPLRVMNKAPPAPRKCTTGGVQVKSGTVSQVMAEMTARNKSDNKQQDWTMVTGSKSSSFQVTTNRAPPPPKKQISEIHTNSKESGLSDVHLKGSGSVLKDRNFNIVEESEHDTSVVFSGELSDSDDWSEEQEEPSTTHKYRHRNSSTKSRSGSSRRKLKKTSPHQKIFSVASIEGQEQDVEELEWETEDEEHVDSGGYEIVERGPDGRLILRSVDKMNQRNKKSEHVLEIQDINTRNSMDVKQNADARRQDFSRKTSDWDSEYIEPDPESDCYTEFDPITPPGERINSLPLPPRQRPTLLKTDTFNTQDRASTTKNSNRCDVSPLSQPVQLPPKVESVSSVHRSSQQGSPSQSWRPPPLPSKESITRLSQIANDRYPVPPLRKKHSLESSTSSTDDDLPSGMPRSRTVPTNMDELPPPIPPRACASGSSNPDDDIPDLPPPPLPPSRFGINSRTMDKSPLPSPSRPPIREHPDDSTSMSERKKVNLSLVVPLPCSNKQDEGYLKPGTTRGDGDGYLDMDKKRSSRGAYIDPEHDLASVPRSKTEEEGLRSRYLSHPPPQLVVDEARGDPTEAEITSPVSPSVHGYLQLVDEDFVSDASVSPSISGDSELFDAEPLYQIYHQGAVLRDVLDNDDDYVLEKKSANEIYCDAASAKDYASQILSRVNSTDSYNKNSSSVKSDTPSSLELIVETGRAMRTLWAETEAVMTCPEASSFSPDKRKIQEALFEIITSEASYLKSLDLLLTHFMNSPVLDYHCIHKTTLSKREHQVLFSNIRKVRDVSHRFLKDLAKLWRKSCVLSPQEVCDVIAKYAARTFDVYVKYCSNQAFQTRELNRLKEKNSQFNYELCRLDSDPVCQGQTIQSFLTLPMQRVTRLPLLVDAVCHRLDPAQQDVYSKVTHALSTLQKLVKECNEGARQMNNIEEISMIDRMLDFKHIKKIPIVSQSRCIVKRGPLSQLLTPSGLFFKKKTQTLDLFLFNDILIITKKKGEQNYMVENYSPRISVHADTLTEQQMQKLLPNGPSGFSHLFLLVLLEKKQEYIFSCESMSECARWVEAIEPAQSKNENERIYESWDCPQVQAVHSYTAEQPDELSLEESDVINVFKKMADGWYEGERIRDGARGWFPADHVVEIQSQHVRAKNLRQQYRMLQMSNKQLADMLENPVKAWKEVDDLANV